MKKQHLMIIFLFLIFLACTKDKSKNEISKSVIVFDSVKVENKFYLYKTIFKRKNVADIVLPEFNRKSDSITLNKVMSKIGSVHNLRFITVAQNSIVFKMYYSPFKKTPEEEKIMEEKFIGTFDLLTNKRVYHP